MRIFPIRSILVLIAVLCSFAGPASAATTADYDRMLRDISYNLETAQKMENAHPGSSNPVLDQLANSLPESVVIETSDGQKVRTDMSWVRKELRDVQTLRGKKRADRLRTIAGKIGTLRAAAQGVPQNEPAALKRAKMTLGSVLAGMKTKPSMIERMWQAIDRVLERVQRAISRAVDRVLRSLGRLFGDVEPDGDASIIFDIIVFIIKLIGIIAIVAALSGIIWWLVNRYANTSHVFESAGVERAAKPVRRTLESVLEAAEREAAQGHYREAFRNIYLASLLLLDRASVIKYIESGTNWEYLRALKRQSSPETTEIFGGMTLLFDQLIYGKRDVSGMDYTNSLQQFRQLEEKI